MSAAKGNQYARKSKDWENALRRALDTFTAPDVPAGTALSKVAEICVLHAISGDKDARTEIANRLDGKPAQALTIGGDDENPIRIDGILQLVRPD